jgi:hypothetical protein
MSQRPSNNAFSPTTMLALVLVSFVCVTGLALLSAMEPELRSGNDGRAHALSKSSVGYSAMVSLTRVLRHPVSLERNQLKQDSSRATLILTPPSSTDADQLLDYKYSAGPIVLILPKWQAQKDPKKPGWVELVGNLTVDDLRELVPNEWRGIPFDVKEAKGVRNVALRYQSFVRNQAADLGPSKPIKNLRTISGSNWFTIVPGPEGGAIIAKHKDRNLYIVADPDLFNNAGLAELNRARLLGHFLNDISVGERAVAFDLTLNGFQRQPSVTRLALEPPLLGATLCLLLAGILMAFQAATRFLPTRQEARTLSLGKRALADNTAALIRMGKREPRMAIPYATLIRRQVMKAMGIASNENTTALYETLDRAGTLRKSQSRYSDLVSEAGSVTTTSQLIKVAADLHQWKQEMTRERQ